MRTLGGFTLVEMMVTIAVVAILLALAVPSFSTLMSTNRVGGGSSDLLGSLAYARSEALKRGVRVRVCRSTNPSGGACTTSAGGWETGWVVQWFNDHGTSSTGDDTWDAIQSSGALGGSLTLRGNTNVANDITFNAQGLAPGRNGQLTVCDTARTTSKRYVIMATSGRARASATASDPGTAPSCPPS